jgi:hypothetical protein
MQIQLRERRFLRVGKTKSFINTSGWYHTDNDNRWGGVSPHTPFVVIPARELESTASYGRRGF